MTSIPTIKIAEDTIVKGEIPKGHTEAEKSLLRSEWKVHWSDDVDLPRQASCPRAKSSPQEVNKDHLRVKQVFEAELKKTSRLEATFKCPAGGMSSIILEGDITKGYRMEIPAGFVGNKKDLVAEISPDGAVLSGTSGGVQLVRLATLAGFVDKVARKFHTRYSERAIGQGSEENLEDAS